MINPYSAAAHRLSEYEKILGHTREVMRLVGDTEAGRTQVLAILAHVRELIVIEAKELSSEDQA